MSLYFVRHAKAGKRKDWTGEDDRRPLDKIGWLQAEALSLRLLARQPTSLHSSPYVRCVQTLEPLAEKLELGISIDERLEEGANPRRCIEWMESLEDGAVLCSHGDVIVDVVTGLERRGLVILGDPDWRKATVWVIERNSQGFTSGRVWAPPTVR
jgi:8-oxo-dGTP diphosphatase